MEISVGFADKDKDSDYYIDRGYTADKTKIGLALYPAEGVEIDGNIGVRYEEKPWITRFEVDGLRPIKPSKIVEID